MPGLLHHSVIYGKERQTCRTNVTHENKDLHHFVISVLGGEFEKNKIKLVLGTFQQMTVLDQNLVNKFDNLAPPEGASKRLFQD